MSIKSGIFEIIGKTIKAVIVNEECEPYPNYHLFIQFDDDQTYEFYGEGRIHSNSGLYRGLGYAKAITDCRKINKYSKDEKGRNQVTDITSKDGKIADKMFGTIGKIRGRVNWDPLLPQLMAPFEWEQAVIRSYCKKCGIVLEINMFLAQELASSSNLILPESLAGIYFEQDTCLLCSEDNSAIVLKQIANS